MCLGDSGPYADAYRGPCDPTHPERPRQGAGTDQAADAHSHRSRRWRHRVHRRHGGEGTPRGIGSPDERSAPRADTGDHHDHLPHDGSHDDGSHDDGSHDDGSESARSITDTDDQQSHDDHDQSADDHDDPPRGDLRRNVESAHLTPVASELQSASHAPKMTAVPTAEAG
jgi:hypothetical protein